jgi:hypothetical protein
MMSIGFPKLKNLMITLADSPVIAASRTESRFIIIEAISEEALNAATIAVTKTLNAAGSRHAHRFSTLNGAKAWCDICTASKPCNKQDYMLLL